MRLVDDDLADDVGRLLRELVLREQQAFGGAALPETEEVLARFEAAPEPSEINLRWDLEGKTWYARAVVGSAPALADLDAEFPNSRMTKPGTGWPLDDDHEMVVAARAATTEWDAVGDARKARHQEVADGDG